MATLLELIKTEKLAQVADLEKQISLSNLRSTLSNAPPIPNFIEALKRPAGAGLSMIAELKARSPGSADKSDKSLMVGRFDTAKIATDYLQGGAKAISVLTDEKHFGGSYDIFAQTRKVVDLPLLHKEFIITPYQLLMGRLRGASAALILVNYFDLNALKEIIKEAENLGLTAVVECSLEDEIPRALSCDPKVLLLNNRAIAAIPEEISERHLYNTGNVQRSIDWWQKYPELRTWKQQPERLLISASCVETRADVAKLEELPFDAFLIGTSAMQAEDRISYCRGLLKPAMN